MSWRRNNSDFYSQNSFFRRGPQTHIERSKSLAGRLAWQTVRNQNPPAVFRSGGRRRVGRILRQLKAAQALVRQQKRLHENTFRYVRLVEVRRRSARDDEQRFLLSHFQRANTCTRNICKREVCIFGERRHFQLIEQPLQSKSKNETPHCLKVLEPFIYGCAKPMTKNKFVTPKP